MADLVERDKAIEAFTSAKVMPCTADDRRYNQGISNCIALLKGMPSAQPEKRTEERTETHGMCLDAISRQAAIDYVNDVPYVKEHPHIGLLWKAWIEQLPPAQPEVIRCTECKHYREYDSKYVKNAVVVQCMADRYPISETIPDGWFCAGAERKDDE